MPSYPEEDFELPKQENPGQPSYPFYRKLKETYYKIFTATSFEQITIHEKEYCYKYFDHTKDNYYSQLVGMMHKSFTPSTEAEFEQARKQFKEFAKLL